MGELAVGACDTQPASNFSADTNPPLPMDEKVPDVLAALESGQCVIGVGETGSGKTLRVVRGLYEAGYKVIATQPLIVASRENAIRIAQECVNSAQDESARDSVAYMTAHESNAVEGKEYGIVLKTDGLELRHFLHGHDRVDGAKVAYVIDEAHLRSTNIDYLLALLDDARKSDPNIKIVILSATANSEQFAEYLSDRHGTPAPIISSEGRTYPIEDRTSDKELPDAVVDCVLAGDGDVLVFVDTKENVYKMVACIKKRSPAGTTVLPIHAEMPATEQKKIMASYPGVKVIVATNVAESSITVPGVKYVVDSRVRRTSSVQDGAQRLYIRPISLSSAMQRRGRAGRMGPGVYIRARLPGYPPLVDESQMDLYDDPAILTTALEGLVLAVAASGRSMGGYNWITQPPEAEVQRAQQLLRLLGAFARDNTITGIGEQMERLPLDPYLARMMVEAARYGQAIQRHVAALVAVQQVRGVVGGVSGSARWRKLTKEQESDLIAQEDVFIAALALSPKNISRKLSGLGISEKRLQEAIKIFEDLCEKHDLDSRGLEHPTSEERALIKRCIITGIENVYARTGKKYPRYRGADGANRRLEANSVLKTVNPKIIAGRAIDIETMTSDGRIRLGRCAVGASTVDVQELLTIIPERCTKHIVGYAYNRELESVTVQYRVFVDGVDTKQIVRGPMTESTNELREYLVYGLLFGRVKSRHHVKLDRVKGLLQDLEDINQDALRLNLPPIVNMRDVVERVFYRITKRLPKDLLNVDDIDAFVPFFHISELITKEEADLIAYYQLDSIGITRVDSREINRLDWRNAELAVKKLGLLPSALTEPTPLNMPEVGGGVFSLAQVPTRPEGPRKMRDEPHSHHVLPTGPTRRKASGIHRRSLRKTSR